MGSLHKVGFKKLTSVEEAWKIIYDNSIKVGGEKIPVIESIGRINVFQIKSKINVPHFNRSAMDGYAIRAEDSFEVSQNTPKLIKIIDDIKISEISEKTLGENEAIKLATGSPIPDGANAVIKVEDTKRMGDEIEIYTSLTPGKNVQKMGEDLKLGDTILESFHQIRAQDIGMLLACGENEIEVFKKPTVAIISTGSELIDSSSELKPGQIYETNSYMLTHLTELWGGIPTRFEKVIDSVEELTKTLKSALDHDIIVFTGGTSVGEQDFLPEIMEKNGKILVHGIAMRPGSPTAIALVKKKLVFCLPGFPVASIVAFEAFVGPFIRANQGFRLYDPRPMVKARLIKGVPSKLGRRDFVRVKLERKDSDLFAEPTRTSGSGVISSTVKADGLLIIREDKEGYEKGDLVDILVYLPVNKVFWGSNGY